MPNFTDYLFDLTSVKKTAGHLVAVEIAMLYARQFPAMNSHKALVIEIYQNLSLV